MFITVSFYRARVGEEDALVALHEDWERRLRARAAGFVAGELIGNPRDPRECVSLMRYASEAACRAWADDPEHDVWEMRLLSLSEGPPLVCEYVSEWQAWAVMTQHLHGAYPTPRQHQTDELPSGVT